MLYTGDEQGYIKAWNLTYSFFKSFGIPYLPQKKSNESGDKGRRENIEIDLEDINNIDKNSFQKCGKNGGNINLLNSNVWKAHVSTITNLFWIECTNCIMSSSLDGTSRLWSPDSTLKGTLGYSAMGSPNNLDKNVIMGTNYDNKWNVHINTSLRWWKKNDEAKSLLFQANFKKMAEKWVRKALNREANIFSMSEDDSIMDDPTPINVVLNKLEEREKMDNERLKERKKEQDVFEKLADPHPFGTYNCSMFHGDLSSKKRDISAEKNLILREEEFRRREKERLYLLERHENFDCDISDYTMDKEIKIDLKPIVTLGKDVYTGIPPEGEKEVKRFVPLTSIQTNDEDESILEHFSKETSAFSRTIPLPPINSKPTKSAILIRKEDEELAKPFKDLEEYKSIKRQKSQGIKPQYSKDKLPYIFI